MTAITRTKELALSATNKKVLAIAGFVALELLIVYGLIPVGIYLWRLFTCAC